MTCPLCKINSRDDIIFHQDHLVTVCRTKDLKGHHERLMVLLNRHAIEPNRVEHDNARVRLVMVGRQRFQGDFYLLHDTFSRIHDHWHMVASRLDPNADDYEQILATEKEHIHLN